MKVLFNNEDEEDIEEHACMVEVAQEAVSQGLVPGKFLVQYLPFLRHIPGLFLGTALSNKCEEWRNATSFLKGALFKNTKEAMVSMHL